MGRFVETKPRMVEYLVDGTVMRSIVTTLLGGEWAETGQDRESQKKALDIAINFWYRMGYDFIRVERGFAFPKHTVCAPDSAPGAQGQRNWADEHRGMICTWEDFEKYPWPRLEDCDFFELEYVSRKLPEGMGLIASHGGGPFEQLSQVFSLEGLALALYDTPDLVKAVNDRIGDLLKGFYRHLVQLDNLVAVFPGDDMGFRTGTMIAPHHLRTYSLPIHKQVAQMAHERGLPYFLHSCGNVLPVIDDLIDDVALDGKHSFEDAILPIEGFQSAFGDRIAVLGGVDVDLLAAGSPDDVRERVRDLMEICGARGRFALGSGASIPNYVPVANYLAMLDEAIDFSR
jgi:uroporphyrinogen decarboxylase